MVYKTWRIAARNVMLSSRQMEIGEFEAKHKRFMSARFLGKFWNEKPKYYMPKTSVKKEENVVLNKEEKQEITGKIKKDTPKFTYEEKDGVLYVYEKRLVAKFDIEKQ